MSDDGFHTDGAACAGKVAYRSGGAAAKAQRCLARRTNAPPRPMLQIYRCQACSAWHLGNPQKANAKAKKRARDLFRAKHPSANESGK